MVVPVQVDGTWSQCKRWRIAAGWHGRVEAWNPNGKLVRWETCGTFLRGRTGANSVLNKEKIGFNFLHTQHSSLDAKVDWSTAIFHHLLSYCHHLLYSTSQISSIKTISIAHPQQSRNNTNNTNNNRWLGSLRARGHFLCKPLLVEYLL